MEMKWTLPLWQRRDNDNKDKNNDNPNTNNKYNNQPREKGLQQIQQRKQWQRRNIKLLTIYFWTKTHL